MAALVPAAPAAGQAPQAPRSEAEELKQAERDYQDIFGAEHERAVQGKAIDKVRFAQKLADAARVAAARPALSRMLREKAVEFAAADPSGRPLALELLRGLLPRSAARAAVLSQMVDLWDKTVRAAKPDDRAGPAGDLVFACTQLAEEHVKGNRFDPAQKALDKAKAAVRTHLKSDKVLLGVIAEQEAEIGDRRRAYARVQDAQTLLAASPMNAAANGVVGMYLLVWEEKPSEAAPLLRLCDDPAHRKLGEALSKPAPDDLELADAYRALAGTVGDSAKVEKAALLARAAGHYRAALQKNPKHPDATRIKLLLASLPGAAGPPR